MSYVFSKALQSDGRKSESIQVGGKIPPPIRRKPSKNDLSKQSRRSSIERSRSMSEEGPTTLSGSPTSKKTIQRGASFDLTQLGGGEWKEKVKEKEKQRMEDERRESQEMENDRVDGQEPRRKSLEKKAPPPTTRRRTSMEVMHSPLTPSTTGESATTDTTDAALNVEKKSPIPFNLPKPRKISMELRQNSYSTDRRHSNSSTSAPKLSSSIEFKRSSELISQASFENKAESKIPYFRKLSKAMSIELEETIAECESSLKGIQSSGSKSSDTEQSHVGDIVGATSTDDINTIKEIEESPNVAAMRQEIAEERSKQKIIKQELSDAILEIDNIVLDFDDAGKSTKPDINNLKNSISSESNKNKNESDILETKSPEAGLYQLNITNDLSNVTLNEKSPSGDLSGELIQSSVSVNEKKSEDNQIHLIKLADKERYLNENLSNEIELEPLPTASVLKEATMHKTFSENGFIEPCKVEGSHSDPVIEKEVISKNIIHEILSTGAELVDTHDEEYRPSETEEIQVTKSITMNEMNPEDSYSQPETEVIAEITSDEIYEENKKSKTELQGNVPDTHTSEKNICHRLENGCNSTEFEVNAPYETEENLLLLSENSAISAEVGVSKPVEDTELSPTDSIQFAVEHECDTFPEIKGVTPIEK